MKTFCFLVIGLLGFLMNAQHQAKVDFIKASVLIEPLPLLKSIEGEVIFDFIVLSDVDSVFLDAQNMDFKDVQLNLRDVRFSNTGKKLIVHKKFKKGRTYSLELTYSCSPKQTVYFMNSSATLSDQLSNAEGSQSAVAERSRSQIWTQGQGKYTSHWLPSFDAMEEKVEFDVSITVPKEFTVIANGKLKQRHQENDNSITWQFDMQKPMSSYLLAFVVGNYHKQDLVSNSGISIENYYYPRDSLRVEPTYRYTKEIFDFLEDEIGVGYPWQNYKQIPVKDFLYAGMENTTATIFSDAYMIDSTAFVDKNYVNVNAHELAHQWFGNLVTEKNGEHHWLHEGFATYYAYLAEKKLFGEAHFYWKLYDTAQQLQTISERGEGQRLLDPKASSLTFYEKGAWALVALRELVGDDSFRTGVQNYLNNYKFKNVTVNDFISQLQDASGINLSAYKNQWLDSLEFPLEEAKLILEKHSESLGLLFKMNAEFERIQSDDLDYSVYWNATTAIHFREFLIKEHHQILPKAILEKAFATDAIYIRQSLAVSLLGGSATEEAKELWKKNFESLLNDKSYSTQEIALIKLWSIFDKDRKVYLDELSNIIGFPNKNIRLLWLTLALVTPDYRAEEKANYLDELTKYTSSIHNPEIRQIAFRYLTDIRAMRAESFKELLKSTNHHSWQFRNFARRLLDELLKEEGTKAEILVVTKQLKDDDLRYLKTKMKVE